MNQVYFHKRELVWKVWGKLLGLNPFENQVCFHMNELGTRNAENIGVLIPL